MRRPPPVDPTNPAALTAWLTTARALVADLHTLTFDATARKGQRLHARSHLRELARRRFSAFNAHLASLDAPPPPPPVD